MSNATVLIIDDDVDLLNELSEMLTSGGYTVATCSSAADALRTAQAMLPDVMLIDVLMPDMNGLEVIDRIRADPRIARIPIIVTSGYCGENEGRKLARVNKFAGFIKKPMNPLEVIAEIERHLE